MRRTKSANPAAQVNPAARTELDRKSFRIASVQMSLLNFSAWFMLVPEIRGQRRRPAGDDRGRFQPLRLARGGVGSSEAEAALGCCGGGGGGGRPPFFTKIVFCGGWFYLRSRSGAVRVPVTPS